MDLSIGFEKILNEKKPGEKQKSRSLGRLSNAKECLTSILSELEICYKRVMMMILKLVENKASEKREATLHFHQYGFRNNGMPLMK